MNVVKATGLEAVLWLTYIWDHLRCNSSHAHYRGSNNRSAKTPALYFKLNDNIMKIVLVQC